MKALAKLQTFTFPCCGFYAIKALALSANTVSREQQLWQNRKIHSLKKTKA